MKYPPLVIEGSFDLPVREMWIVLTDPSEMRRWYFDIPDFRAEIGAEFRFTAGPKGKPYLHLCRVTEVIVGRRLAYTWCYDGYPGTSELSFDLYAHGDASRLVLTHSGLETFPATNPDFARENFRQGWTHFMDTALKAHVERREA